jgi:hypothetical protein
MVGIPVLGNQTEVSFLAPPHVVVVPSHASPQRLPTTDVEGLIFQTMLFWYSDYALNILVLRRVNLVFRLCDSHYSFLVLPLCLFSTQPRLDSSTY